MKRREFIAGLGAAATSVWPLIARAQQNTLPVIGLLSPGSPETFVRNLEAFRQGLAEAGYVEGRNVVTEYRWAQGQLDRLPTLAAGLVWNKVSVIAVLGGSDAARAAKNATTDIPIVFYIGNDPVASGLVASLNRPGGNVTGITLMTREVQGKRLAMTRELLPHAAVIATFTNPTSVVADFNLRDLETAAAAIGVRLLMVETKSNSEIEAAFAVIVEQGAGALFLNSSPFFGNRRDFIVALAARHRVPTIFPFRESVEAGGLISYGSSSTDANRQVGNYTGRILKGEKPADLPVVQSSKFEMVINLKAAKALGLTVPLTLRALADEVIE